MSIKDLALAAKTTVDGFMSGMHKSNVKGTGMEFSQYRSYQPGDDLRWLDWKMYARSDRYYIRESEMETSISVRFVLDASASMNHQDGKFSKLDYARYLIASLAYLANQQSDAIGLYSFQDGQLFSLPCRKDHQHLSRFFFRLEEIKASGKFTEPVNYKDIFSPGHKRELLIFVTDFYQENNEITTLLHSFAALRHEIMVFHVIGNNELNFDFKGYESLEDLETGQVIRINLADSTKEYQQKLETYLNEIRVAMLDNDIFYRLINMKESIDKALRDYLNQRNKMKS